MELQVYLRRKYLEVRACCSKRDISLELLFRLADHNVGYVTQHTRVQKSHRHLVRKLTLNLIVGLSVLCTRKAAESEQQNHSNSM